MDRRGTGSRDNLDVRRIDAFCKSTSTLRLLVYCTAIRRLETRELLLLLCMFFYVLRS